MKPAAFLPGGITPTGLGPREAVALFATSTHVMDSEGERVLDMAGGDLSRLNSGRAPLLADHVRSVQGILGVVEAAWLDGERALCRVRFGQTRDAEEAWCLVRDGIASSVSMGFRIHAAEPLGEAGARRITAWQPYEISLVPLPADWRAQLLPVADGEAAWQAALQARRDAVDHRIARAEVARLESFADAAASTVAERTGLPLADVQDVLRAEARRFLGA